MTETASRPASRGTSRRRADVGGLSIAYAVAGSGPPLVLLHGFTHDSRVWRPQLEGLADEFTVVAWDAPGAGQSPDPPESFGIAEWADALAGFLDAIGVHAAQIGGLSWGGLLAQEFYGRHPTRVLSLVLADTYAGWSGSLPPPVPEQRREACIRDSARPPGEFLPLYVPGMFSPQPPSDARDELTGIMADFHPAGFRMMATALARADTCDLLPTIDVPTLLIWGDADVRSPIAIAAQFQAAVPDARLVIIPRAGHVSNLERPLEFNAAVRAFCRANVAR